MHNPENVVLVFFDELNRRSVESNGGDRLAGCRVLSFLLVTSFPSSKVSLDDAKRTVYRYCDGLAGGRMFLRVSTASAPVD